MASISFRVSKTEQQAIADIVKRAKRAADLAGITIDPLELNMDLCATHANGCPLDFDKLLAFPDFDFNHDIFGIRRFIDRSTGKLTRCFLPRCVRTESTVKGGKRNAK